MDDAALHTPENKRQPAGLVLGTLFAACLALVFGLCLWTALDATRPPASKADGARATILSAYNLKQPL
jgi:hypothetical protein